MKLAHLAAIRSAILSAVEVAGFEVNPEDIHLEPPHELAHGHFSSNIALLLASKCGKKPVEVANQIIQRIKNDLIQKTDVAGPGFINLWLEQKFYTNELASLSQNPQKYVRDSIGLKTGDKTMVIEYSSPNIAKPLGVHHLLSTIIGDSLKRIYKAYGYKVFAENYPGDTGTQFGKLMVAIQKWGDRKAIEKNPIDELLKLYVRFHEEAPKNPSLEDEARAEYKKWEEGDRAARDLWKRIVDWSFREIQPLYDRLEVTYDGVHGESFFEEHMKSILEEGREKGIFVEGREGAWIVLPDDPRDPPAMVRKSDGATLYLTRDLAQMDFLEQKYRPDIIAWVVDVAQSLHFKQRFYVYRKLRNTPTKFVHVVFGRMDFRDGGMSTRKGNVIRLSELLDEAEARAQKLVKEKAEGLSPAEAKALAKILGIGSVKYNILSQNRLQNITFDWDKILSFEGNSAPYLLYTATRARSIFKKAELRPEESSRFELNLTEVLETKVVVDLMMYPDALRRAAEEFKPNHIANCLYILAQDFNRFYNALPVLKATTDSSKNTRLLLTAAVVKVMEHGLELLGLKMPEKM